jgi:uncharacterized damage-inducible protein DinB
MDRKELLVERLYKAREWTKNLITDIDAPRWFDMPFPGFGHAAWQIGHLAASQVILVHMRCFGMAFEDVLPAEWKSKLARGSTPVADAREYPPLAEIRAAFDRIFEDAVRRIRELPDGELDSPAGAEPHPMFATKAQAIGMAVMHETFHAGQIAMIRRWMGKAPLR